MAAKGHVYSRAWHRSRNEAASVLEAQFAKMGKVVRRRVKNQCDLFTASIPTSLVPVYTGNLLESTGAVMYYRGKIQTMTLPRRRAFQPQTAKRRKEIWGHVEFKKMQEEGARRYSKGLVCVLYSAVPYASYVNTVGSPKHTTYTNPYMVKKRPTKHAYTPFNNVKKKNHTKNFNKKKANKKYGYWVPRAEVSGGRGVGYFDVLTEKFQRSLVSAVSSAALFPNSMSSYTKGL